MADERPAPKVCVLGASAGGVTAVREILSLLAPEFRLPLIIVQHLPASSRIDVDLIYGLSPARKVIEVEDKMAIESGYVYMAAPGYHLLVERDETFSLSQDEPENYSRPSIDVLFNSVAKTYGAGALGILLTGANADGALGLSALGQAGAQTIVQDPLEAECDTMPKAAIARRPPDQVLPLRGIAGYLNRLSPIIEEPGK